MCLLPKPYPNLVRLHPTSPDLIQTLSVSIPLVQTLSKPHPNTFKASSILHPNPVKILSVQSF
jgi:hypothetical protein